MTECEEWNIGDTDEYKESLEKLLIVFENSEIGDNKEAKKMIEIIRASSSVNVHYEYIEKLTKMFLSAYT